MIFSNKVLYKGEILFTKYIPIIISLLYYRSTKQFNSKTQSRK